MAETFSLTGKVREANKGDLEALKALDDACFELPWAAPDFEDALKSRGAQVVLVVEHEGRLIAYAVYTRLPKRDTCQVLRIGVLSEFRRKRIGTQLLKIIRNELDAKTVFRICVQEEDLVSQIFLRHNGLTAVQPLSKYFRYSGNIYGNAIEFVLGGVPIRPEPPVKTGAHLGELHTNLKNRITRRGKGYEDPDL